MLTKAQKETQKRYRKKYPLKWKEYYNKYKNNARELLHELKINGCSICKYNKCFAALEFHHVCKANKKFNLKLGAIYLRDLNSIFKEYEKCVLLCSNCHRELHNPPLREAKGELEKR